MAPSALQQRRTHNSLLFQKLLNLRDGASPFTLVLDTLEQSARPVIKEFMLRAKISKTRIIFASFQTLRKPRDADIFIRGHGRSLAALQQDILSHVAPTAASSGTSPSPPKTLVIFDTLHPLATTSPEHVPAFLSSLLNPTTSVVAVYHTDVPIPSHGAGRACPYAPDPFTTLCYLATAILRVASLAHVVEKKKARDRSLAEPGFGISEEREGVLIGLGASNDGVVVEMEIRRKSGRGVRELFVLGAPVQKASNAPLAKAGIVSSICLLDDHPLYSQPVEVGAGRGDGEGMGVEEESETTFSLGLTEKQRRDREGVVLPYFDAQTGEGPGEGGRILYEMGREDDYDEDEDDEF
ncbi:MAG: hypothetical protein M1818_005903 [Claussenomyces sp. TS43310]|nr:MAG: hypothetical protein M1818_005903 [Claussenomyces sp. TS43310]